MSVSFSAEMSDRSVYQVVCECGAYAGNEAASFRSVRFAADLFNANGSKSYADCMEGCARYYVESMGAEVNMSNSNAGMFFAMLGVAEDDRWNGGSMDAAEFKSKAQMVSDFGDAGSYANVRGAELVKVAEEAIANGVKVCWG